MRVDNSPGANIGDGNRITQTFHLPPEPVRWPVTFGLAPREVTGSVDRRARLTDALTEGFPVVLVGDGGVGKTELAAQEFRARDAHVALWVTATSRATVLSAYRSAAAQLRLDVGDSDEATAARLVAWLRHTDQPWVVVLDDVGDPEDVHDLLPHGPTGLTIVTTRWTTSAVDAGAVMVDVGVYTPEEASRFLRGRFKRRMSPGTLDAADELARELGYLPLALAHAAAVILDDELTCGEYLKLLQSQQTVAELMPSNPREIGSNYRTAVSATWHLALEHANARRPIGLARPLWEVISCLDPNGIPLDVLLTKPVRDHLAASGTEHVGPTQTKNALRNLSALSLIPRVQDKTVRTHMLAQRVTREALGLDDLHRTGRVAADALAAAWPSEGVGRAVADNLASNIDVLRTVCPDVLWQPDAHGLLFGRGRILGRTGRAVSAARYFARLAEESASCLGARHPDTMLARQEQAEWTGTAGQPGEAANLIEALLAGGAGRASMHLRFMRAIFLGEAGDTVAAAAELGELADRAAATESAAPFELMRIRTEHARWISAAGDPERALQQLGEVLAAARAATSADSERGREAELRARFVVAECQEATGRALLGLREWRDLAADVARELGPTDALTLTVRHRLALAEARTGTIDAAATVQQRLVDDLVDTFDPEDPRLIGARVELARYRGLVEGPRHAVAQLSEALNEGRRDGRPEQELFGIRENLAKWRGRGGRADLARRDYTELLRDQRAVLGDRHPDIITTRYQLIHWSSAEDRDLARQRESLEALLADAREIVGERSQMTLLCRVAIVANRHISGEQVEREAAILLDELTSRGLTDSTEGLHLQTMLLSERLVRGDRGAMREVRELLPRAEARVGVGHPVVQVLRHNLTEFAAHAE